MALVLHGHCIAVLPAFLIAHELRKKTVVDLLPKEHLNFDLKVIARETAILSLNATTFLKTLREAHRLQ